MLYHVDRLKPLRNRQKQTKWNLGGFVVKDPSNHHSCLLSLCHQLSTKRRDSKNLFFLKYILHNSLSCRDCNFANICLYGY
ncbi:hypothetical protein L1887_00098 [Cichorium endivia]|nr:hypothetical protein L1887_00098 [Cichorium endivia]